MFKFNILNQILNRMKNKIFLIAILALINSTLNAQLLLNSLSKLNLNEVENCKVAVQSSIQSLPTYSANSVLAQGKFVKVRITDTGVYKLTFEDLTSMGIDPANVRIFGYGGGVLNQSLALNKDDDLPETAIWMEKGKDGDFNAGDYILFYAQGVNRWSYDATKGMFTHQSNTYSNAGYYFVTSDAGHGKKILDKTIVLQGSPTIHPVEEFVDYKVYEKDLINITNSGKEFYGEIFDAVTTYSLPFTFPNPVLTNSTIVRLDVAAASSIASVFTLKLNGQQPKTLGVPKSALGYFYEKGKGISSVFSFTPQNANFGLTLNYDKPASASIGYLNYLEVNVRCQLKMVGSVMPFQNVDFLGTNTFSKYLLSDANANIKIWDVTDPANIGNMITETIDGKVSFIASSNEVNQYIAIDPTAFASFAKPEIVGIVPNQNLHGIAQADMVILTHPDFVTQAETLAQAHRQKDNMTVAVVTTDQVYNEFSSGTPDATAYRRIMKMLRDRAITANNTVGNPKYLLLFGRGSFDNRKILTDSGDNLILTYQTENSLDEVLSYLTDDYFAFLDDNEGTQLHSDLMDIGVGRFPVTTVQQATDVVNKTIAYMNNSIKGNWKNNLCFLADDGDTGLHAKQADSVAAIVERTVPAFKINKIFMDTYKRQNSSTGNSYPEAKSKLMNLLQSGLLMFNYTGHGGPYALANEKIITVDDISSLKNTNLPIWMCATADFNKFDIKNVSAGENVLLNPVGGGIGVLSPTRLSWASQNFNLNNAFCSNLFKKVNGKQLRMGDAIRLAKNQLGPEINKLLYTYLGDPALILNFPTEYKVITNSINKSTVFGADTLKAQSINTIKGIIADESGNLVSGFNGNLHVELFDKIQRITTLDNDKDGTTYVFSDRPVALYTGDVAVVDGTFSIPLKMPNDINLTFGTGRIIYYAQDETNNNEANGYFENFIVGGTDMKSGIHQLTSSTGFKAANFPNPVNNQTRFVVNNSSVEAIIKATVDIFDISGRKIKSICESSIDNLTWDLSADSGSKVKAGVYMYCITLKTHTHDICSVYNKLIVID